MSKNSNASHTDRDELDQTEKTVEHTEKLICGVVMPISAIDDCNESHWSDVLGVVSDAINNAGFLPNIVSNSDESGIIQKRVIQNLFDNPIVVCDVSGKNPNVMFELGMRLAFDKPTIVIKDDRTDYSFDTSPIEHIGYPRDLRFTKIVDFKRRLTEKIIATAKAAADNPDYTTFLKHFGEFKIAQLEQKEVGPQEYILDELKEIRSVMRRLQFDAKRDYRPIRYDSETELDFCLIDKDEVSCGVLERFVARRFDSQKVRLSKIGDHFHLLVDVADQSPSVRNSLRRMIRNQLAHAIDVDS